MATNPFTSPRPTWQEVIDPLADSPLWPNIRRLAGDLLSLEYQAKGYEDGISSSDINHTIFGLACWVERDENYVGNVLRRLIDEVEYIRPPSPFQAVGLIVDIDALG